MDLKRIILILNLCFSSVVLSFWNSDEPMSPLEKRNENLMLAFSKVSLLILIATPTTMMGYALYSGTKDLGNWALTWLYDA